MALIRAEITPGKTVNGKRSMCNSDMETNAVFASRTLLGSMRTNTPNDTMATINGAHIHKNDDTYFFFVELFRNMLIMLKLGF